MYPAAIHKIPTQTVASPQVLEKNIPPKATKDNQQKYKKLGQKHNQSSGTGLSRTGPWYSLLIAVVKDKFHLINITFLINPLSCTLNFSIKNPEKKIESFWKI